MPGLNALCRIEQTCGVGLKHAADLIAHATEHCHLLLFTASGMRGIVKAPVMAIQLTRKNRACLIGVAANGDHRFDLVAEELVEVLRAMIADVDADLGHGLDAERMDITRRFRARALDAVLVAERGLQDAFGKVGPAAVAGAENEDGGWFHVW